jgi:hypothetical protein
VQGTTQTAPQRRSSSNGWRVSGDWQHPSAADLPAPPSKHGGAPTPFEHASFVLHQGLWPSRRTALCGRGQSHIGFGGQGGGGGRRVYPRVVFYQANSLTAGSKGLEQKEVSHPHTHSQERFHLSITSPQRRQLILRLLPTRAARVTTQPKNMAHAINYKPAAHGDRRALVACSRDHG